MSETMERWLIWLTPALATLAVLLEAGYEAGTIHSATSSLVVSILTAIAAYVMAIKERNEHKDQEAQKLPRPQTQQQPQKPAQK